MPFFGDSFARNWDLVTKKHFCLTTIGNYWLLITFAVPDSEHYQVKCANPCAPAENISLPAILDTIAKIQGYGEGFIKQRVLYGRRMTHCRARQRNYKSIQRGAQHHTKHLEILKMQHSQVTRIRRQCDWVERFWMDLLRVVTFRSFQEKTQSLKQPRLWAIISTTGAYAMISLFEVLHKKDLLWKYSAPKRDLVLR